MPNKIDERDKLVPLRRFHKDNLYNISYLSVLAQRKKLRVKKIGRNYYTTENWFLEYLDKHGRKEIRDGYKKIFQEEMLQQFKIEHLANIKPNIIIESVDKKIAPERSGFFVLLRLRWFKTAGLAAAFLILLSLVINIVISLDAKRGIVAGEEEAFNTIEHAIGTSSILQKQQ